MNNKMSLPMQILIALVVGIAVGLVCYFGGFADIVPAGCTLLAESAVAVKDVDRADLARRIQEAKEDAADAKDDQTRSKAEQFLSQLTTLEGAILPA